MLYPMMLRPALKQIIWGGTKLKNNYPFKTELERVAEAWILSGHKDGNSVIENGEYTGLELTEALKKNPDLAGGKSTAYKEFPMLIKLIDAAKDLSIQVHPADDYALSHDGEYGKTEMWYIVEADLGAFIYFGFNRDINKQEFKDRIEDGSICEVLNRVECKAGDVYFIPAGTIHAIGAGLLVCEIQQSSNTTYRVFDYHRLGPDGHPRALHVEKAMDVANLNKMTPSGLAEGKPVIHQAMTSTLLASCSYFTSTLWELNGEIGLTALSDCFGGLVVLSGQATLTAGDIVLNLVAGSTVFIPANMGEYSLSGNAKLIYSSL